MKVLVAGGAGFIGSHLIDALIEKGHEVICVDNYFIGSNINIQHLFNNPKFSMYEEDLTDFEVLKGIFEKEKPEYVFHMAANSDIQKSALNPQIEYKNTYTTTFHLLECMRIYDIKKFFFCSTSAVYGDTHGEEMDENYAPLEPISYYGACKLGSESLIHAYSYMNHMHSLIFRFPNVIGPRLTHGVIFDFINKLKKNPKELEILGDGLQTKPYLYVLDLINCIMENYEKVEEGVTIYNVGDHSSTSVTDIAKMVCEVMGLEDVAFHYTGGKAGWKGDVPVFMYNLDKIHATGWKASMTSDEAVYKTIEAVLQK